MRIEKPQKKAFLKSFSEKQRDRLGINLVCKANRRRRWL